MKTHMLKKFYLIIALVAAASSAHAQQSAPPSGQQPSADRGSDKVDLKKLEDKYWSAKDDYGVIQNRTFAKAGRAFASLVYGPLLNDPFVKARATGLVAGYHFTEDFGLELSYMSYGSSKSESVQNFNQLAANISPNFNTIANSYTISGSFTPFYAKMAFMNKAIMYFDMGFTAGIGATTYTQQALLKSAGGTPLGESQLKKSAPHFEIGLMQQLFINRNIAFRADIKNTFYNQAIKNYQGGNGQTIEDVAETTSSANDTTISFGATLFFD